jgi:flagellar secretion chaperone FliS
MWQNGYDAYLESRLLSADPVELVRILYQTAVQAVRDARRHLAAGEICERSRAVTKACEVLVELACALDHERGGEFSRTLAQLYDYMQLKLTEANIHQQDPPLAEVLSLLNTLAEGWDGIQQQPAPAPPAAPPKENRWEPPAMAEAEPVGSGSHAWSL